MIDPQAIKARRIVIHGDHLRIEQFKQYDWLEAWRSTAPKVIEPPPASPTSPTPSTQPEQPAGPQPWPGQIHIDERGNVGIHK